ncbi:MAG: hypothetical protein KA521_05685 [Crocinitomicaceae bacterium]|nr:hypothetical protein [Crocinitomicaceae bacterium]
MHFLIGFFIFVASFSKAEYFKIIAGSDASAMTALQSKIEKGLNGAEKDAYTGALKMKQAESMKTPKEKLTAFKEGKIALEAAILVQPKNTEFRFLRIMIQENAPKILKYQVNLKEDASYLKEHYLSLSSDVKNAVIAYSKSSNYLKL